MFIIDFEDYEKVYDRNFYSSIGWKFVRTKTINLLGNTCGCCKKPTFGKNLHVDHIKSKSKYPGRAFQLSNTQVLCGYCNNKKKTKTQSFLTKEQFLKLVEHETQINEHLTELQNNNKLFFCNKKRRQKYVTLQEKACIKEIAKKKRRNERKKKEYIRKRKKEFFIYFNDTERYSTRMAIGIFFGYPEEIKKAILLDSRFSIQKVFKDVKPSTIEQLKTHINNFKDFTYTINSPTRKPPTKKEKRKKFSDLPGIPATPFLKPITKKYIKVGPRFFEQIEYNFRIITQQEYESKKN